MKNCSILIAEDDLILLRVLRKMVEDKGLKTYVADNGATALELFHAHKPDIVLMDIDMPEKDGWEVLEEIRRTNQFVPVIIMTGRSVEEQDSLKSYEMGATFFVRKPFHLREIVALIDVQLKTLYGFVDVVTFGSFVLNMYVYSLKGHSQTHQLTEREARVLYILVKNINRVVETKVILQEIWHDDESQSNRQMLKNTVARLRKLIEDSGEMRIESLYARGYILYSTDTADMTPFQKCE